ncbi:MAG: DUF814 domain-containing protein [Planctomycetes bacterium]|nr:DUF814 domain-containing protein [Planctomycetota bacterium]
MGTTEPLRNPLLALALQDARDGRGDELRDRLPAMLVREFAAERSWLACPWAQLVATVTRGGAPVRSGWPSIPSHRGSALKRGAGPGADAAPVATTAGRRPPRSAVHRRAMRDAPQLWQYELDDGWLVLVGRTDLDNDRLSIKLARANDWWFHVRGHPGSHVVLRVDDREPGRAVLEQAAAIAAWHSKLRAGGQVAVSATRARFVTKPRGAKPGTVQIRKEQVLKVRPSIEHARKTESTD